MLSAASLNGATEQTVQTDAHAHENQNQNAHEADVSCLLHETRLAAAAPDGRPPKAQAKRGLTDDGQEYRKGNSWCWSAGVNLWISFIKFVSRLYFQKDENTIRMNKQNNKPFISYIGRQITRKPKYDYCIQTGNEKN